ncbi:WecB/TagA/CpsF family glycosyltransferase [Anaeroselena agilis]|uniref:WecB/TagA/CpsF family glycosyltransferase n=1 Tax=Anaeroselena agilis TaxID=3063788 RepID=UPI0039B7008A
MRVDVLGVQIDAVTLAEAVRTVEGFIAEGGPHLVATANAEMVMAAGRDRELARILADAALVVPDGAGVVWAARHLGQPVPERVAGFDLAEELLARAATEGWRVFFFGGAPGIAAKASEAAAAKWPGLTVAGVRDGYFAPEEAASIAAAIRASKPHILLAALGVPKQEKWLAAQATTLAVPVSMGVGGTFDVMAGVTRRAPLWMQRAGLEWLYRLGCDPKRIGRMMALPRFVMRVLAAKKH